MKRNIRKLLIVSMLVVVSVAVSQANAAIIGVDGPLSSVNSEAWAIDPPSAVLDGYVTNTGQEGFDEAQRVVTTKPYTVDGGGEIPAGTLVDSHMIFLNSALPGTIISHYQVDWTFSGDIIGVMSDEAGTLEADSTEELGAPGTAYPAAGFATRGMEWGYGDSYELLDSSTLRVNMRVSEPGDWIRVVTAVGDDNKGPSTFVTFEKVDGSPAGVVPLDTEVRLVAWLSDKGSGGGSNIASAKCRLNRLNEEGAWFSMEARDGAFDSPEEVAEVDPGSLGVGVYTLFGYGTDSASNIGDTSNPAMLAVYDPGRHYVAGAGYFGPILEEDKPYFAFVSGWNPDKRRHNKPSGSTEIVFLFGDLKFTSSDFIVQVQEKKEGEKIVKFKGEGFANGYGCKFMVRATDSGNDDRFKIKIWNESFDVEYVIYENTGQEWVHGMIIIGTPD